MLEDRTKRRKYIPTIFPIVFRWPGMNSVGKKHAVLCSIAGRDANHGGTSTFKRKRINVAQRDMTQSTGGYELSLVECEAEFSR